MVAKIFMPRAQKAAFWTRVAAEQAQHEGRMASDSAYREAFIAAQNSAIEAVNVLAVQRRKVREGRTLTP